MAQEVVECDLCKHGHNLLYTFTLGGGAWNKGVPSRSKREGEVTKPVSRSRPCVKIVRLSEPCALHDDCILFARPNTSTWSGEGHSAHFSTQPTHFFVFPSFAYLPSLQPRTILPKLQPYLHEPPFYSASSTNPPILPPVSCNYVIILRPLSSC